jgi:hypothetical protein
MPSVNPGPAQTITGNTEAVIAPQTFPNFNSQGQGTNAYRLLAVGRAIPIASTGDAAFLPLINTNAFDLLGPTTTGVGSIIFANPLALVAGVLTPTSIASTIVRLWSGPNQTGTALLAATTLSTLTATANATTLIQVATPTALGYYLPATWGVGATTGTGGAASYGIYFNVNTASGVTASQVDCFVYGSDFT